MLSTVRRYSIVCLCLVSLACSNQHQSQRDSQREQLRNQAQLKRLELAKVSGEYFGLLESPKGLNQSASIHLEVKDLPSPTTEGVDPRIIPSLSGYIKVEFGLSSEMSFAITSSEFDPQLGRLSLVASNANLGEVRFDLKQTSPGEFKGQWIAPSLAAAGESHFRLARSSGGTALRSDFPSTASQSLQGEFNGYFYWEKQGRVQKALLTLTTLGTSADSFKLTASLRLFYGDQNPSTNQSNSEYLTYHFSVVQFNPLNGLFSLQDETGEVSIEGKMTAQGLQGEWSSRYTGNLGRVDLRKEAFDPSEASTFVQPLQGSYLGTLLGQKDTSLPETLLITITSAEQTGKARGLSLSGYVRFYWGPYPSHEFQEFAFTKLEYNAFTHQLLLTTENEYRFTFTGKQKNSSLDLQVSYEPVGQVGNVLATKVAF